MDIQDLNTVRTSLDSLLSTNLNRSFSGVFKHIRRLKRIDMIGDYPVMTFILTEGSNRYPPKKWSRTQVLRAIRYSKFFLDEDRKSAYIPKEWEKYLEK